MKKEIPIVNEINLRNNPDSNKFIQFYVDGKAYMRFIRSTDLAYHFDLLLNTLVEEFEIVPESSEGIPKRNGKGYTLVGAGIFRLDKEEKIVLYSSSFDYLRGPDEKHAREISKLTGLEFILE